MKFVHKRRSKKALYFNRLVTLGFGDQTLGEYLFTEVSHHLACNSVDKSTFKAISNNAQVIPAAIPTGGGEKE